MKKNILPLLLPILLFSAFITLLPSCQSKPPEIQIISTNLSHRVVLLDAVETRLNLMIGFKIPDDIAWQPDELNACGQLSFLVLGRLLLLQN